MVYFSLEETLRTYPIGQTAKEGVKGVRCLGIGGYKNGWLEVIEGGNVVGRVPEKYRGLLDRLNAKIYVFKAGLEQDVERLLPVEVGHKLQRKLEEHRRNVWGLFANHLMAMENGRTLCLEEWTTTWAEHEGNERDQRTEETKDDYRCKWLDSWAVSEYVANDLPTTTAEVEKCQAFRGDPLEISEWSGEWNALMLTQSFSR